MRTEPHLLATSWRTVTLDDQVAGAPDEFLGETGWQLTVSVTATVVHAA